MLLGGCTTPSKGSVVVQERTVTQTVTEILPPVVIVPQGCLDALAQVENLAMIIGSQIPSKGGMTPQEVDRLDREIRKSLPDYQQAARACREGR